jgi:hypothetical protein
VKRTLSLLLVFSFLFSYAAHAESESLNLTGKRALIVGKAALYGAGGGLVVGLASQVFKKKGKNIFLFGSLGMYAGIILGIYVISSSRGPAPYEGPDTYEDYGDFSRAARPGVSSAASGLLASRNEPFRTSVVNLDLVSIPF